MIGHEIGKYRVTAAIGEGGMGAVYLATHTLIGRQAAIKVLLPEVSHNQEIVQRFFNEARATTAIKHPGIVEVYDFGYHTNGAAFIVMEYLEGEPLAGRMKRLGQMPAEAALNIIRQVAGALHAAHNAGIVHRDLKPDNIFLVSDPEVTGGERIKILDFGIAKLVQDGGAMSSQTRTGTVMGTPAYMAPEQCKGAGHVDLRADLYALGCILFEMVCGRLPFVGEGSGEILAAHIHVPPPQPRGFNPTITPQVESLIMRMLEKEPGARPQSSQDLIAEIGHLGLSPWRATTPQPMATGPQQVMMPTPMPTNASVNTPTTLSSAAAAYQSQHPSAVQPSKPRSRMLPIALGMAVVAGGVAIAVMAGGGSSSDEPDQQDSTESAAKTPETAETTPERVETPKKAVPTQQIWTVISEPAGAYVYRKSDGMRLGKTPYGYSFAPTAGELVFVVKREGFKDATVVLPAAGGGERLVKLAKLEVKKVKAVKRSTKRVRKRTPRKRRPGGDNDAPNPFD